MSVLSIWLLLFPVKHLFLCLSGCSGEYLFLFLTGCSVFAGSCYFHDISIPIIGRGVRSPCVDDGRVVEHSLAQHGERASVAESSGTDPRP